MVFIPFYVLQGMIQYDVSGVPFHINLFFILPEWTYTQMIGHPVAESDAVTRLVTQVIHGASLLPEKVIKSV